MPKRKSSWSKVALPPSAALTQEVWHEHHSRGEEVLQVLVLLVDPDWESACVCNSRGGILEIFAVSQGIVGIRGVFSNKFLAMSKKGKLHASARFTVDCHFRERFQENSYNTYASAVHRSPRSGRPWYVALNKRGKAKRGCSPRARPQHVSTHFLPRFWQPQPPELAFTVALPEKKPPLPKPKVAPSPPRRSPGKYRLKFRFG
ncbi:fibroblast growth factor 5 isoform X2 [Passer montanus]|uniref:fibroblast growth factor 5 isoform X2 n=1 Tax=Passer montanus TaxID=9160 RepID=UPI0019621601|nr:fibroblast growth factor 5 isoform X2 [Passer montanus]XP_039557914.1 fibroblast growth factor 5 isoform X2 [Passer montanus]